MLKIFIVKDTKNKLEITKYLKKNYFLYAINKYRRNLKTINLNINLA